MGKDIWYVCIEGFEVVVYERGIGIFKNGEVFVLFFEYFELVVNL